MTTAADHLATVLHSCLFWGWRRRGRQSASGYASTHGPCGICAGSGGEDLEHKLLSDVARGTESSCKSLFVAALLDELVAKGHRTLVFSQSRVMLDILQVRHGATTGQGPRAANGSAHILDGVGVVPGPQDTGV
jgi:hypothetical protein